MILYFSATGNSKHVAERLAQAFSDTAVSVEKAETAITLAEDELLGIVTPVHFGQLPVPMRVFLQNLTISAAPRYCFLVTTYGTTPGCTFADAKRLLKKKSVALQAGFGVQMPDTWTPFFDLSDAEKVRARNEAAEGEIDAAIEQIQTRRTGNRMPRSAPYLLRLFADPFFRKAQKTENFHADESCIGCGVCAKKCPMQEIEMRDGKPVWVKDRCAICLRCLHLCPKFAICYGDEKTKQHGQYRNPHTSV